MAVSLEILGKRLKSAREKKGYKQAYIAEVVNLSLYQVSRIENGARSVYIDTLSVWCDLLEISMIDVLSEAEMTEFTAYGRIFDQIAVNCDDDTVMDMLDACRVIEKVANRTKENKELKKP